MNKITDRLQAVITEKTEERRRWKSLEELSGITAMSWQNFWRGKQRPTAEMLEAVCQEWPEYAFWITTGITDPLRGHIAPQSFEPCFPVVRGKPLTFANQEWKYKLALMQTETAAEGSMADKRLKREQLGRELANEANVPALFLSYEDLIDLYGEKGSYQYVELVFDEELNNIEEMRRHEELALSEKRARTVQNIKISAVIDTLYKRGVHKIRGWFSREI
ncbi:hypothetical protein HQ393_07925 [Chitinibacter bivalviorum]|uniref:Uncharacterized protein n=1 Tax=Chitinibacter bivalviorum TaxID=2739434 RepID=A0A7H9BIK3_9NEIS|nr:hypothetical protein [Chitinibacter bivalviorum]QLG88182.1 hypothetical protein HQ393_07925 [Chitinibacter bivalviorum]